MIDPDDVGLVICWDLSSAYAISKFGDQQMQKKQWRKKTRRQLGRQSTIELQKYRTGPIVDKSERTPTAEHMSYTAVNEDTLESRLKSEISSRLVPEGSTHDDALESGEFHEGYPTDTILVVLFCFMR